MTAHPDPEATTGEAGAWRQGAQWGMRQPRWPVEWQPIETAPKDGTCVLLWDPEDNADHPDNDWTANGLPHRVIPPSVGFWHKEDGRWQLAHYSAFGCKPTHWMPLPEPPGTPNGGEP